MPERWGSVYVLGISRCPPMGATQCHLSLRYKSSGGSSKPAVYFVVIHCMTVDCNTRRALEHLPESENNPEWRHGGAER